MKKILLLTLLSALLLSSFSCGKTDAGTDTETDEESYVMTDISGIGSPLKIDGEEVPYAVFRYYYAAVKYRYDRDNDSYWDKNDYTEKIRNEVLRYIRRNYAVYSLASQYNVELDEMDKRKIKQDLYTQRVSQYENDYAYYQMLDAYFLTEDVNCYVEETAALEDKLFEYLTSLDSGPKISSDTALVKRYLDNYVIRADHILILNDEGDDENENETLIKELYEKLKNGADFEELKEQYSEDDETKYDDVGYYMAKNDISEILSDAAFSLSEGEISGVITAPYGYHIVKRLAKDDEYIKSNLDKYFVSFYRQHIFEEMLNKQKDKQTVIYDESFYTYTPRTIK